MKTWKLIGRDLGLGGALMLLGGAVAVMTSQISSGFSYDNVGPRVIPYLVAAGLLLSGCSILVGATTHKERLERNEVLPDWISVAAISAALLAQMFAIDLLGWIPVATAGFAVVSWAFGSRRMVLNLLFGLVLATLTFVLFNYGLGLKLPAGQLL